MIHKDSNLSLETSERYKRNGLLAGITAFCLWGVFPLYFILVREVSSVEVLLHRVIWAVPIAAAIIHFRRQWSEIKDAFKDKITLGYLCASAIFIAGNWLVYIAAVQQEQIFQASLGYYINPLFFALAGVVVMGEKLRGVQSLAFVLAAIGVIVLTVSGGEFPAIALFLGTSFAIYGVIRKKVMIGAIAGLLVEHVILLPLAVIWLLYLMVAGKADFGSGGIVVNATLIAAGPISVVPLMFFVVGTQRLNLSTIGIIQFIGPTLMFLIGVLQGEELTIPRIICFGCIWVAVILFCCDSWLTVRRR